MSKITTIYDNIITVLDSIYPGGSGYTRIPNPYNLEDNADYSVRKGYGLKVDTSTPEPSEFKNFSNIRTFTIVLTRQVIKLESDAVRVDISVKEMLEDVFTGQKKFFNQDQIDLTVDIEAVDLGGQSGIIYFKGDKENFISVEFDLSIQFTEDL